VLWLASPLSAHMDGTSPFCHQLKHVPEEWRQPIVDVVDTFSTVKLGLDGLGIKDTLALIEAVKLVIDRHDKSVAADL